MLVHACVNAHVRMCAFMHASTWRHECEHVWMIVCGTYNTKGLYTWFSQTHKSDRATLFSQHYSYTDTHKYTSKSTLYIKRNLDNNVFGKVSCHDTNRHIWQPCLWENWLKFVCSKMYNHQKLHDLDMKLWTKRREASLNSLQQKDADWRYIISLNKPRQVHSATEKITPPLSSCKEDWKPLAFIIQKKTRHKEL